MNRLFRAALVTAGLAAAGAVFGAVAAIVAMYVFFAVLSGVPPRNLGSPEFPWFVVGPSIGYGAVLGPAVTWLLLRRVPLGRAVLGTTAGAVVGGLIGAAITFRTELAPNLVYTAAAGVLIAALILRSLANRGRALRGRGPEALYADAPRPALPSTLSVQPVRARAGARARSGG